jgi:hypothetical protein
MPEEKKKTSLQDLDVPGVDKEDEDEGLADSFGKWVRDRLKTGKKKMVEVEE